MLMAMFGKLVTALTSHARGLALLLALLALVTSAASCSDGDDGTKPGASDSLPKLHLTDDTDELLLTWMDDRGATHTGLTISEVPESSKKLVRVTTKEAGHGSLFYVADLSAKQADGSYAVRTMRRTEWEGEIEQRRSAWRAKHAPPPKPKATGSTTSQPATPAGDLLVVVYGAPWCKPCHQATAYLKRRGIRTVEYNIDKDPKRNQEMVAKLKRAGKRPGTIPVIDVGGILLQGYSQGALSRAIQKATKGATRL
ncbi:MAG: NrdH-redoxin [Deltaproteobacteria bacterium]|nr:NrdH-redoxin [Deltaproteobacteria bacterium]